MVMGPMAWDILQYRHSSVAASIVSGWPNALLRYAKESLDFTISLYHLNSGLLVNCSCG